MGSHRSKKEGSFDQCMIPCRRLYFLLLDDITLAYNNSGEKINCGMIHWFKPFNINPLTESDVDKNFLFSI